MIKTLKYIIIIIFITTCSNVKTSYSYEVKDFKIKKTWKDLSLDEKIGQMFVIRISGNFYNNSNYKYKNIKNLITNYKVGGLIMFYGDIHGAFHNINLFQNWSETPLLIGSDYERGVGQWMDGGTLFPSNMAIAATGDTLNAYKQGNVIAKEAKALGVHMIFAPVLDVNNNPKNPIINLRAYSDSPDIVSEYGRNFIRGVQEKGVFACAKHFPGHGNTDTDSHSSLPTINTSIDDFYNNEIAPFRSAVKDNVRLIMIGHLVVPSYDSSGKPATHSKKITTTLLKEELGFNGVVITDAMEMGALSSNISNEESVLRAIEAGADIILLPIDTPNAIKSVKNAIENGRISESRIDESVEKIWNLKKDAGLFDQSGFPNWTMIEKEIGLSKHQSISNKVTKESITLIKDEKNAVPIKPEKIKNISHIILSIDDKAKDYLYSFSKDVNNTLRTVNNLFINYELDDNLIENIIQDISKSDAIIISSLVRIRMDKGISTIDPTHLRFLKKLNEKVNIPIILVGFGSPYLDSYDYCDAYLITYGYGSGSMRAVANAIFGRSEITGKLPVDLNDVYKKGFGLTRKKRISEFKKKEKNEYNLDNAWKILDDAIKDEIFPGAQVFISKEENIVAHKGVGRFTYDKSSSLVDISSIYDIASITKVMTTVPLIMKLVSRKKISINNYINEYYPNFKGDNKDKVQIKHLLTHSSGMKDYVKFFELSSIKDESDIINNIINRKLLYKPGEKFDYSDLGFILLKDIIEKTNRSDFSKLCKSWIFNPLNMNSTYFNPPEKIAGKIVPTEYDSSYRKRLIVGEVHDENAYLMNGVSGHAGVFSNAGDIAKFTKLFLNEGTWLGSRHFSTSMTRKFTNRANIPKGSDMALGWDTPSLEGNSSAGDLFSKQSFGHLGFTGTSVWADKENQIIIILLTNRVHPSRNKEGIKEVRRSFYNSVMSELIN